MSDLAQDLRYALRMLRRSPAFASAAILSLALGIGANVAVFTLINAVILRSLPVPDPARLVQITRLTGAGVPGSVSYPIFEYFRDSLASVSGVFAQVSSDVSIVLGGEEDLVKADLVSGSYFSVLGLEPAAGRFLTPADDVLSPEAPVAVISDRYWQRRFGRSPSAIGTSFTIRDRAFTIVGVTPALYQSARTGSAPDLLLPLLMNLTDAQRREPTNNWLNMLGRLKPGATLEQADAEVQVAWSYLGAAHRQPRRRTALGAWPQRPDPGRSLGAALRQGCTRRPETGVGRVSHPHVAGSRAGGGAQEGGGPDRAGSRRG